MFKIKTLLFTFFILFFAGCSFTNSVYNYSKEEKKLIFGKDKAETFFVYLTNPFMQYHSSYYCVNNSYTLNDLNKDYGRLFVEYISLNSSCNWNGLSSSFFESNLKSQLNLKTLETVEEFDINSYVFKTLKVNDDSYISFIHIYGGDSDKFILDFNGKLYDQLLKKFKSDYKGVYLYKKRFQGNYNDSLVRKNIINRYFKEERFKITPHIGISISI